MSKSCAMLSRNKTQQTQQVSVKFVQIVARNVCALRGAFKLSNALLEAVDVCHEAVHLGPQGINSFMKRGVSFKHVFSEAAQ